MNLYDIDLKAVTLLNQGYKVLDTISVDFPTGKTSVIIGPSGCGKSTLLKVAAGLLLPDEGLVEYNGKNFSSLPESAIQELRSDSGFVFQDSALWANQNLFNNLALVYQNRHPKAPDTQIQAVIETRLLGFDFNNPLTLRPDQISAGERKILSFIRATMNDPSLLFLDDPTLSVDPINSQRIREILQTYRKEKRTIIMLTHDSELASQLADHMIVMDHAKIIASGPLNFVLQSKDKRTQDILAIFKGQVGSYSDNILDVLSGDQW